MVASSSLPLQQQLDGDDEVATAEAAIPAAEPVERGRLLVGEEEDGSGDDDSEEQTWNNTPNGVVSPTTTTTRQQLPRQQQQEECLFDGRDDAPASPDSFNADELFENILIGDSNDDDNTRSTDQDQDLEKYLLPSRRTVRTTLETSTEDDDDDDSSSDRNDNDNNDDVHNNDQQRRMRRYRKKRNKCHCCPSNTIMPCSSSNYSYVGNMIIVLPKCYNNSRLRFGIIGPHWYVSYDDS
jgi:hypothetical protein